MASHARKLEWWAEYQCDRASLVEIEILGRGPVRVHRLAAEAFRRLSRALEESGYESPLGDDRYIGSYWCRNIAGKNTPSLHAFGIAVDVDYGRNPVLAEELEPGWGTHPALTITEANIDAVLEIRVADGRRAFKSLAYRPNRADPMHFEVDVPPEALIFDDDEEAEMPTLPTKRWAATLRDRDVYRLADLEVITHDEGDYFVELLRRARDESDPLDFTYHEFRDLERAVTVRLPIWGSCHAGRPRTE